MHLWNVVFRLFELTWRENTFNGLQISGCIAEYLDGKEHRHK